MHPIYGRGRPNHMDDAPAANKPSEQGPTENGSANIKYHRLINCHCASLDLETAFKSIKISQEIKPDVCQDCKSDKCRCPAFMPGTPCSSASSMPINTEADEDEIPALVENTTVCTLYPPVQSPSDEEADREVAAICRKPVYYQLKSRNMHRR